MKTVEEVVEDLNIKCPRIKGTHNYFNIEYSILGDRKHRRSFNDLVEYYNVSDETLMEALIKTNITCYYCSTPKRMVFFRWNNNRKNSIFHSSSGDSMIAEYLENDLEEFNFGKYTPHYLDRLYKKVKKQLNDSTSKTENTNTSNIKV